MVHVILKRECLDEDINIEYKPPPSIVDPKIVPAPAHQTTILTKNEIIDDLGMEIQIDGEMAMLRSCYVAVDKLPDRVLVSAKPKSKMSSSERKNVPNGDAKINDSLKPFSCDFCPKTFARKDYLNTHRLMHTKKKIFKCDECPKKFITQNYLNKHFRSSHFKPFVCVECPMKFKTESLLQKHKRTHELFWTKTKTYECYVCKEKRHFWKIGHLINHMRSRHSSERPYHCEQCPKTFAVKQYLTAHKATHSLRENIHECNVCHKSYYRKTILASHMKIHYTDRPFKCEKCPKAFLYKSNLRRHIQTNSCKRITHLPKGSTFQCYICSKETKTLTMLRKHVLLVHLQNHSKIYSCDKCPKKYTSSNHLQFHQKAIHSNERPFACTLCSKSFNNKAYLTKHVLVHSKEKPFVCEICSRAFAHKSNLNRHAVIHVRDRKFECAVCFKKFLYQSTLNSHKLTHVSGIEFTCTQCPKKYLSQSALRRHIKLMHTQADVRLYKCELCQKSFKENTILKSHWRAVHLQLKPFECSKCRRKFSGRGHCSSHERICKGPKPFGCKICFKKFESKIRLSEHVKIHTHTGTKRYYECYICKYLCEDSSTMVVHMRCKHTEDKPFACDICPHRCSTSFALKKHKIIHNSEYLFSCDRCPKTFKRSESLQSHKFTHENGVRNNKKVWIKIPIEATD